jgi:predicted metal-binding protein
MAAVNTLDGPTTELIICTTCRPAGADRSAPAAGQTLLDAVQQAWLGRPALPGPALRLRGIACLSGCSRACTVALQAAGKPSYVFGDLAADADTAAQLLVCAELHAGRADGQLARNDRPPGLRNQLVLRLPPLSTSTSTSAAAEAAPKP